MPNTDSVILVKRFTYRGQLEEFSNRYHLTGTTPTTPAGWKTLYDAMWASEKTIMISDVKLVRAYGYAAGNEHAVDSWDYVAAGGSLVGGTASGSSSYLPAGDQAAFLRAKRATKSVKGKNVYCQKFYHGVPGDPATPDKVNDTARLMIAAHGAKMLDGTLPGSMKWDAPQGGGLTVPQAGVWMTTRTLKRRGKRPS